MRSLTLSALALVLVLVACGGGEPPAPEPDGSYTVRGRIMEVGESSVAIHHEAIPDFTNREGEVSGMDSMTMMFHRPESVPLAAEVGDAVELTFDVRWSGDHTLTITRIGALEEGVELELSAPHH